MTDNLKTKIFIYAFALGLSLWLWWKNGALVEDQFMIWIGTIFIVGMLEIFGLAWDLMALLFVKLRKK